MGSSSSAADKPAPPPTEQTTPFPFERVYRNQSALIAMAVIILLFVLACFALLLWILLKKTKPCCCPPDTMMMGLSVPQSPPIDTTEKGDRTIDKGKSLSDTKVLPSLTFDEPMVDPSKSIYIVQLHTEQVQSRLEDGRVHPSEIISDLASRFQLRPTLIYTEVMYGFAAQMTPELAHAVSQNGLVEQVASDFLVHACGRPRVPNWQKKSHARREAATHAATVSVAEQKYAMIDNWARDRVGLKSYASNNKSWRMNNTNDILVFMLDSGVDSQRNESGVLNIVKSASTVWWESDGPISAHGTHAAGIIGSSLPGMNGALPGVRIVDIRMLDSRERGTAASALAAIDTVFKLSKDLPARARVVHLGFGAPVQNQELNILDQCVQQLVQNNITVVAPAGNTNRSTDLFSPAHTPGIISVGSYDKNNKRSLFTNTGERTVLAPGEGVISLLPGNKSGALTGSSVATAYVTGLIVLTLASMTSEELASQTLTPEALLQALILKSINVGTGSNPVVENIPPGHFNRSVFMPPA